MANIALAVAEAALRSRKLDRTLTTHLAPLTRADPSAASTDIAALDASLRGGLPRGHLSELAGPRSSGRTTVLLQALAAATRRGELAALVDTFDCLDVASVIEAHVDPERLLWIRGHNISRPQASGPTPQGRLSSGALDSPGPRGPRPEALVERLIDRALKAFGLVLQAGGFGVVVLDVGDVPFRALQRLPCTTWLRVQRTIEGSETAGLLVVPQPLARSAGGLTLSLTARSTWIGDADRSRRLTGLDVAVRIVSPRRRVDGQITITAQAEACALPNPDVERRL